MIMFTLTIPNNNAWSGKWSGDGNLYAIVRREPRDRSLTKEILDKGSFDYNFGDGWGARVFVERVDSRKAANVRKKSRGFYGYDWMADEIIRFGRIKTVAGAPVVESQL